MRHPNHHHQLQVKILEAMMLDGGSKIIDMLLHEPATLSQQANPAAKAALHAYKGHFDQNQALRGLPHQPCTYSCLRMLCALFKRGKVVAARV
eukprot:5837914-Amphidinium_carterae.1